MLLVMSEFKLDTKVFSAHISISNKTIFNATQTVLYLIVVQMRDGTDF